jgi:diaminopimelate epimerase
MAIKFTKMQGAGNDFVVIDATKQPFAPSPGLMARLTDRRHGVGCDQVLVIDAPSAGDVDFNYRIFNSDGSESGQCGNGARCLGRYVRDHQLSRKPSIRVRTNTSVLEIGAAGNGDIRVNMGVPRFEPREVPFTAPARAERYSLPIDGGEMLEIGAVSIGNPHAVLTVADVDRAPVAELGESLQRHPAFPERVNVGFLQVIDRSHARLRVYERGAGETLACGSGACAAAVVARMWGQIGDVVEMRVRGGVLKIEWKGEGEPVYLSGPAEEVFAGEMEWPK